MPISSKLLVPKCRSTARNPPARLTFATLLRQRLRASQSSVLNAHPDARKAATAWADERRAHKEPCPAQSPTAVVPRRMRTLRSKSAAKRTSITAKFGDRSVSEVRAAWTKASFDSSPTPAARPAERSNGARIRRSKSSRSSELSATSRSSEPPGSKASTEAPGPATASSNLRRPSASMQALSGNDSRCRRAISASSRGDMRPLRPLLGNEDDDTA
mmetsp:Transcript_2052/g.7964  ORF Transcript_2052/g.7964 Transcript_2052/m.7964 type:complete len:216 (-) Transcript_2052:1733-2380(-)